MVSVAQGEGGWGVSDLGLSPKNLFYFYSFPEAFLLINARVVAHCVRVGLRAEQRDRRSFTLMSACP